jgi:hypothetical protein
MRRGMQISSTIIDVASPGIMLLPSSPRDLPVTAAHSACNNNTHVATLASGVDALDLKICLTHRAVYGWSEVLAGVKSTGVQWYRPTEV